MTKYFDAIVIGAGQAGPPLVARMAAAGMSVAIVERHFFGGTCVNVGCMPTKTLIASAQVAHLLRRAGDFGVAIGGQCSVDMRAVKERKDGIVKKTRAGVEERLRTTQGCSVYHGEARFVAPHALQIDGETIGSDRIFINVGCRASVPPIPGLELVDYLTNTSILEMDSLPRHLAIIGGSYIGLEFAQMYRRFGAEVTLIEKGPRLIGKEDPDVSLAIQTILEDEGISVHTNAECIELLPRGTDISVAVKCPKALPAILASHVLLATGRSPNTDSLDCARAGIDLDSLGFIPVDDQLRTNVPGIWALGDCNGKGAFTHTSYNDFEIVAANLLDGQSRRVSDRIPCYGLFIDPPLGRVGMTETEARAAKREVRIATRPMSRVGRAIEQGETQGFMKVVVDAVTEQILGASILGIGGDEVVHGILDTMSSKAPYSTLCRTMHIHPTVSELIPTMLEDMPKL